MIFPASVPEKQRFRLTEDDYRLLYRCMSELPVESAHPFYDRKDFPPAYVKFLLYGADSSARMIPSVRIFNKVGWAYGFLTDNAYIVDFDKKVEFMLSATIYVNKDDIQNDDTYEYDQVGLPFLKKLGRVIYEYELQRPRKYLPVLSRYKVDYR